LSGAGDYGSSAGNPKGGKGGRGRGNDNRRGNGGYDNGYDRKRGRGDYGRDLYNDGNRGGDRRDDTRGGKGGGGFTPIPVDKSDWAVNTKGVKINPRFRGDPESYVENFRKGGDKPAQGKFKSYRK